jgi:hypothetical protein
LCNSAALHISRDSTFPEAFMADTVADFLLKRLQAWGVDRI